MRYQDKDKPIKCKYTECGLMNSPATIVKQETGPHFAHAYCHHCKRFLDFVGKPDKPKAKRAASHTKLVKMKQPTVRYCEMCLRMEPIARQAMEGHHSLGYAEGGDASAANTWVLCTECHALVTWRRNYAEGTKIHDNDDAFIEAVNQQRATRDAGASDLAPLEARAARKRTDEGAVSSDGQNGEQHGPKHVGEFLSSPESDCPF